MKLTRGKRIALELLGPAAIGATMLNVVLGTLGVFEAVAKGNVWSRVQEIGRVGATVYLGAYIVVGLQSILYTLVMEWQFTRGLDPRSWRSVTWSTTLGFLSGAAIVVAFGFNRPDTLFGLLYFGGIGSAVGFALGMLIRSLSSSPAQADGKII